MTPPFARTTCGCALDVENCRTQPGYLVPGDLQRLADHLGRPLEDMRELVRPSPGAVVGDSRSGQTLRIGTMTPRRAASGACVFLTAEGRCRVHPVAPFGCAFFDVHQTRAQSDVRSLWGLRLIVQNEVVGDGSYRRDRERVRCCGDPD